VEGRTFDSDVVACLDEFWGICEDDFVLRTRHGGICWMACEERKRGRDSAGDGVYYNFISRASLQQEFKL
jgi:hypothetical protein